MNMSETKVCNVCNNEKALSEFYYRKETGKYRANCKKCKPLMSRADIIAKANAPTKICKDCGIEKPSSEYQNAGGGKWKQPYCKPCDADRKKKHTEDNRDAVMKKKKEYSDKNREILRVKNREHYRKNSEHYKQYQKDYAKHNGHVIKARQAKKVEKARLERKIKFEASSEERAKKKDAAKARKREGKRIWCNMKSATDISFKVLKNLRSRTRFALKRDGAVKSASTEELLGCTIPFFRVYFESLFTEGMTWESFMAGDIHIDHKRPCKKYDLTKESEQRLCFNYKNLQPLWESDNLKKGTKYNECQTI